MKAALLKAEQEAEEKVEIFYVDELRKILACSEKEPLMWQAMIFLLADTGMRRGEACGLRWADIEFTSGRIHIVNNAQYTEGKGVYDTKTKRKETFLQTLRFLKFFQNGKNSRKRLWRVRIYLHPNMYSHTSTAN